MSEPLKVGDKLWRVGGDYGRHEREQSEVEVVKIGRKWATIKNGWREEQANLDTLVINGGQYSSPGRCYRSEADYHASLALAAAWHNLARRIGYVGVPKGVTLEWIEAAHRDLGIPK